MNDYKIPILPCEFQIGCIVSTDSIDRGQVSTVRFSDGAIRYDIMCLDREKMFNNIPEGNLTIFEQGRDKTRLQGFIEPTIIEQLITKKTT